MNTYDDEQALVLVRHAETESNLVHALDTRTPGAHLTERGKAQAQALARGWEGQGVRALYHSHLLRTQQTADALARATGLTANVREGLGEIAAGHWEMSTERKATLGYLDAIRVWLSGDLDSRLPGGETGLEVLERFDAVIDEITASESNRTLVISHGAIIRMWTAARADGITAEHALRTPLRNTCAIILTRQDDNHRWRLKSWQERPPC